MLSVAGVTDPGPLTPASLRPATENLWPAPLSDRPRGRGVGVQAEVRDGLLERAAVELVVVRQREKRRDRDILRIDLEEPPQRLAGFRPAEAVGAQRQQPVVEVRGDLLRQRPQVVARGD